MDLEHFKNRDKLKTFTNYLTKHGYNKDNPIRCSDFLRILKNYFNISPEYCGWAVAFLDETEIKIGTLNDPKEGEPYSLILNGVKNMEFYERIQKLYEGTSFQILYNGGNDISDLSYFKDINEVNRYLEAPAQFRPVHKPNPILTFEEMKSKSSKEFLDHLNKYKEDD
jgi:hypothetical protein